MKAMLAVRKCASALALAASIAGACLWAQGANANPGDPDTTFGGDGIVEFALSRYSGFDGSMATYPDARTVTVSVVLDSANHYAFSVQRFTPTGSPDLSFGLGGTQLVYFPGYVDASPTTGGIAVQSDGKIVVAGRVIGAGDGGYATGNFAAFRLLSNGQFDSSFAWGGEIVVPMGFFSGAYSMVIDRLDGGILLAGSAQATLNDQGTFALLRLTPSGWPDPAFGSGGKVFTSFSNINAYAEAVAVQSTGKIVLAGRAGRNLSSDYDMALARFNRDGSLDTTFGKSGKIQHRFKLGSTSGSSGVSAIALQSNDAIVVGGVFYVSPSQGGLMRRYTNDGQPDTSFAGGSTGLLFPTLTDISSVAVQSNDKILGTGGVANQEQYVAFRTQPSGALDSGFGSGGYSLVSGGESFTVALQSYGCIMLGGYTASGQGAVVRLLGDPHTLHPWDITPSNSCYSSTLTISP